MNSALYLKYLNQYVNQAIRESDGSISGIAEYLGQISTVIFARDKDIKQRFLRDAIQVFSEHRHWPLEIILSHLGVDVIS